MEDTALLVEHVEFKILRRSRANGESRRAAAENGALGGLHLAAEGSGSVDDVVDGRIRPADVLVVVDVAADIHVDIVLQKDGVDALLHVGPLGVRLGGLGVDGMVSHDDGPGGFVDGEHGIKPAELPVVVLFAAATVLNTSKCSFCQTCTCVAQLVTEHATAPKFLR